MQKFSLLFFLCIFTVGFGQSVELKKLDGIVYPDVQNFCTGETFNLKVDAAASSTGDYETSKLIGFNMSDRTINVPFSNKVGSNHFSNPISIGFNFSFYGINYDKVVVGSNGRLVFTNSTERDILHTNVYTDRINSGNNASSTNIPLALLSTAYNKIYTADPIREIPLAQIFAGFTDVGYYDPSYYNKITYGTTQYNGIDGLLISFKDVLQSTIGTGYDKTMKIQILILKNNDIIVNVVKDNVEKNAILGIQNENASKFKIPVHSSFPQDYNNKEWRSEGFAWLFHPNQILTPKFKWTNNGVALAETSNTLTGFAPANNDVLKVEVTYLEDTTIVETDQVTFNKINTPIIEGTLGCVYDMKVTAATYDPNLRYTWYRVGETAGVGSGQNFSIPRQGGTVGDYYVKISNLDGSTLCAGSNESNHLNFSRQKFPVLVKSSYCLTDNTLNPPAFKTISLYDQFYPKYDPASGLEPYQIIFSTNTGVVSDADAANFVVPANTELNLQFAVKEISGGFVCHNGGLTLYYLSMPPAKSISLCASVATYNLKSIFQNPAYPLAYAYYYTYADDGSIADGAAIDVTRKVNVKTSAANCSINTIVSFVLGATVTLPDVPMQERCAGSDTIPNRFDFNLIKTTLDPTNQYDIKFYSKSTNQEIIAVANSPTTVPNLNTTGYFWSAINGDYLVYAKVIDRADPSCFSVSNDILLRVYNKPTLRVQSPISLKNCPGNSIFNLSQDASALTNAGPQINVKLEYYSASNVLLSNADIAQYDASVLGASPYIKIIYNISCSDVVTFNLGYYPKPAAAVSQILICAETNYSLQDFKNKISLNPSNYTFTDVSGNPLPANFDLSILPSPIKFFMKDNTTGCISDLQTVTFVQGASSSLLTLETDFKDCDKDFDGKMEFDLDTKKSIFTTDTSAKFEYFKDVNLTQSIAAKYTNNTAFAETVHVRITIPGFCPTPAKINLIVNTPTKSSTLIDKYFICYNEELPIDAGGENKSWNWSTGEITRTVNFRKAGTYSVELTNLDGCKYTHDFIISDENQPTIEVINQTNNSIEVIANGGTKPYKYYFNGVLQTSNILSNPTHSSYEIQVESATGCLGPPKTVYFIKINNAFTPNGDGINDVWRIDNLDKMDQVSIVIIDRNGKKVFESTTPTKNEWDGKDNGRALPTSSYWYIISWYDPVTQKTEQRQGWILMKNRN